MGFNKALVKDAQVEMSGRSAQEEISWEQEAKVRGYELTKACNRATASVELVVAERDEIAARYHHVVLSVR